MYGNDPAVTLTTIRKVTDDIDINGEPNAPTDDTETYDNVLLNSPKTDDSGQGRGRGKRTALVAFLKNLQATKKKKLTALKALTTAIVNSNTAKTTAINNMTEAMNKLINKL